MQFTVLEDTEAVTEATSFLVAGAEKTDALSKLRRQEPTIPAGRLRAANISVLADQAEAEGLKDG